jgi:hypothetical protein
MTRTQLTAEQPVGPYPGTVEAGALALTWTACDPTNFNACALTGNEVLLLQNTGDAAATVTIHSVPDPEQRTDDISDYSIPAGDFISFSFLAGTSGWLQSDGNFYFDASAASVLAAILYCER